MTEKELEILFRKKFDERTVEFNPAAWEGAERLIIAGEKRRRRRAIIGWSTAASVAAVLGFTAFSVVNSPTEAVAPNAIAWPSQSESTVPAIETVSPDNNQADPASMAIDEGTIAEPQSRSGYNEPIAGESVEAPAANSTSEFTVASSSSTTDVEDATTMSVFSEETSLSENQVVQSVVVQNSTSVQVPSDNDEVRDGEVAESTESSSTGDVNSTSRPEETVLTDDAPEEETLAAAEDDNPIIQRPRHRVMRWSFGLEGGLNVSSMSNGNLDMVPSFYGGIPVELAFAENWMIRSGVFYSHRASYGQSEADDYTTYSFGRRTVTKEFTSSRLGYVEMPLTAVYSIGNHEVELGGYAGMRVLEVGNTTSIVDNGIEPATATTYNALTTESGSAPIDAGLRFGYAYRLTERWRITAYGTMGLLDGYDDPNSGMNRQVQLRFGARYMLGL
ncbi:MAG: PorT family protein [Flavobacteriia bacterium]|nr:PorT family protein [Flavobacteriia bacterium]